MELAGPASVLHKVVSNYQTHLDLIKSNIAVLGLSDANSLISQVEAEIIEAQQQVINLHNTYVFEEEDEHLALLESLGILLDELAGKLNTLDSYVNKVIAQREFARQEEAKVAAQAAAQKAEQERIAASVQSEEEIILDALAKIPGLGAKRQEILLNHFGSATALRDANYDEIRRINTLPARLVTDIFMAMREI